MGKLLDRFDMRAFLALELTTSMVALTFVLALRAPDSDVFKILLGAMLTVGFASAVGWYFNSSSGSDKKDELIAETSTKQNETISAQSVALGTSVPAATVTKTVLDPGPPATATTTTTPAPEAHKCQGKRK